MLRALLLQLSSQLQDGHADLSVLDFWWGCHTNLSNKAS